MKKIKILHMTPPIVNNGIYKYIFMLYRYIDHDIFEFNFLMQNPEKLMETDEYQEYHFGIRSFTTTQRDNPEKFRKEIYSILSDGYDVLELHTSYWRGFMIEEIAMEIGIPRVIVHSHSAGLDNNDSNERFKQLLIHDELKKRFSMKHATDFWACSTKAADWLYGENIPREKIKIIKNPIEVDKYQYNESIRNKLRKELKIEDSYVIGHTGRFEYQKNHVFLLKVLKEIKKEHNNVKLMLVGEGKLRNEIEEYGKMLGIYEDILFLGWRDDIPDLLQAMDLYCLPSRFEGLPLVLIEAQSADLKCIVSDAITTEAGILPDYKMLPLDKKLWVEEINSSIVTDKKRIRNRETICKAGFDIGTEIKNIEKAYMEGLEK